MRFIIDGGRSNAHQALRVHKDYTGRGIATLLGNYAHREIMKRSVNYYQYQSFSDKLCQKYFFLRFTRQRDMTGKVL